MLVGVVCQPFRGRRVGIHLMWGRRTCGVIFSCNSSNAMVLSLRMVCAMLSCSQRRRLQAQALHTPCQSRYSGHLPVMWGGSVVQMG